MNQDAIAEQIGVSRKAVSFWETGRKQPGIMNLMKFCAALGLTLDDLLGIKKTLFLLLLSETDLAALQSGARQGRLDIAQVRTLTRLLDSARKLDDM